MFYIQKKPYFFNNSRYSLKNHLFSKFYPYFLENYLFYYQVVVYLHNDDKEHIYIFLTLKREKRRCYF
uniref:Uncharacterized protein n=1 Tax=Myoviridae sp. ct9Ns12 TaxID=2826626 RepID=A0A8S5MH36_9CAUD|nr:MAG TPA: hypothetical protein [Myoviridae sp. ct9Ns12]